MFRQCAGDAAPGSSQTAFGSGSPLLAPLSNFRAGTLPTTVSIPHSHKPETDSLPARLAAFSPSLSLSLGFCLCLYVSLSFFLLSLFAILQTLFSGSWPLISRLCPSFLCHYLVLCLQDYRSALSFTVSKSCSTLLLSLVSGAIPSLCQRHSNTHSRPARWL